MSINKPTASLGMIGSSSSLSSSSATPRNNNNNSTMEEETPTLRAVALQARTPGLQFDGSGGGGISSSSPFFGKAPPSSSSSSMGLYRANNNGGGGEGLMRQTNEWNAESSLSLLSNDDKPTSSSSSCNWNVCDDDLQVVPLDFPLERTHLEISGGIHAKKVAQRISQMLCLLSIQAEYYSHGIQQQQAKAKCQTMDMVRFCIRLFAGGNPETKLPVIVEVQRRSGSPSSFRRVCQKIFHAAQHGIDSLEEEEQEEQQQQPARKRMFPPFQGGPISSMKCLANNNNMAMKILDPNVQVTKHALEKAMELLRSKQKDINLLGWEYLVSLTTDHNNSTHPDDVVALKASTAILLQPTGTEIRDELTVLLQKDAFLPEEELQQQQQQDAMKILMEKTRHLALVLLSNALVLTASAATTASTASSSSKNNNNNSDDSLLLLTDATVKSNHMWFATFLIPTLLDEIKSCCCSVHQAHHAYEAARGVTALATAAPVVARRILNDHGAVQDLWQAHLYGKQYHALLASETQRALQALGHYRDDDDDNDDSHDDNEGVGVVENKKK